MCVSLGEVWHGMYFILGVCHFGQRWVGWAGIQPAALRPPASLLIISWASPVVCMYYVLGVCHFGQRWVGWVGIQPAALCPQFFSFLLAFLLGVCHFGHG